MLDLAISIDTDSANTTVIETNHGIALRAPGWPRDCDFQLVAFNPSGRICEVVWAEDLAQDIGTALVALDKAVSFKGRKPDWYRRLERYGTGSLKSPGDSHQKPSPE
jgi:hypothetical protein